MYSYRTKFRMCKTVELSTSSNRTEHHVCKNNEIFENLSLYATAPKKQPLMNIIKLETKCLEMTNITSISSGKT